MLDRLVGAQLGIAQPIANRGDAQHPAPVRHDLTVLEGRPRVEDLHPLDLGRLVEATDDLALRVVARVSLGGHDHADRRALVPLQGVDFSEPPLGERHQHRGQVRLEPHQQRLSLGVAKPDVEFQHLGALVAHHQAGVQHPLEWAVATLHGVDGGDQDLADDVVHHQGRDLRGRAVGPHSPGVGPLVFIVCRLVVLRCLERDDGFPVGEREDAHLFAIETLLDHQLRPGVAELPSPHDPPDGVERLGPTLADRDPLARGETVGLDHQPGFFPPLDISFRGVGVVEHLRLGGRNGR